MHRWSLIVIGAVVGAVIGVAAAPKAGPRYESRSVVLATHASLPLSAVGGLAQVAFDTSTVISPVIVRLRLKTTPQALLSSREVEAQAVSGTGAIRVFGRANDPKRAIALSNTAAASLASIATAKGLGTFVVFPSGQAVSVRRSSGRIAGALLGAATGALAAIAILILRYFLRRPILTVEEARAAFPADVVLAARVQHDRPSSAEGESRGRGEIRPAGVVPAIWNAAQRAGRSPLPVVCCLFVDARSDGDRSLRALEAHMREYRRGLGSAQGGDDDFSSLPWSAPQVAQVLGAAKVVVALVAKGARRESLEAAADEVQLASGPQQRILVFVR